MINVFLVIAVLLASEDCSPCSSTNRLIMGQVGNYQVNSLHYEVIVHAVDAESMRQFIINGEKTDFLIPGESFTLHDGSTFTVSLLGNSDAIFCINGEAGDEIIESCDQSFCIDDDGPNRQDRQNTFSRGHQLSCWGGRIYEYYDGCWGPFELLERLCSPVSSYPGSFNAECPNGCLDGRCLSNDTDGDGISNTDDSCPTSILGGTIMLSDCDSGVANQLFDDGCTMTDLLLPCLKTIGNHGACVRCIRQVALDWKNDRLVTGREFGQIMRCAGQKRSTSALRLKKTLGR